MIDKRNFLVNAGENCIYSYHNHMEFLVEEAILLKYFSSIKIKILDSPPCVHVRKIDPYISDNAIGKVTLSIPFLHINPLTLYFSIDQERSQGREPTISFQAHTWEDTFYSISLSNMLKRIGRGDVKIAEQSIDFIILLSNYPVKRGEIFSGIKDTGETSSDNE